MKIVYLGRYNFSEELSGPEKVAKRIYEQSVTENNAVFVEYFFDGSKYGIGKKLFGKEVVELNGCSKVLRLGLLNILPFLFKFKPQILHIITFERFTVISYLYKIISDVKIIFNVHGIAVYENVNFKKISGGLKLKDSVCEKIFMSYSDKLLFLSEKQLQIGKKYYNIKKDKTEFILNGVDKQFFQETMRKKEINSIVFIGDSERKDKDFNFLYLCLQKIRHKCNLYVVGSFNYEIYKSNIGNVNILQVEKMNRDSLIEFLTDKSIFVSSSAYDTFSIAAAECMAMGIAPVVTDTTGISKLIINGENGLVVKHGDIEGLASAINLLLEDLNLRNRISRKSLQIYNALNWENIFTSYRSIYNSLIK